MSGQPIFTPRAPRKRSGGSPMGPIVAVVVVAALGAGGYFWMTRPVDAPRAAPGITAPAGPAAYPNDPDGFRSATEGQLALYDKAVAELGLGDALDVDKARAAVEDYRSKVAHSQALVGRHRRAVADNVRNATLNVNRAAGGGPEGRKAMDAFDARHADALKRVSERWMLEARVAELRGQVMQTLAWDKDNGPRLGADVSELRAAEGKLRAFKAEPKPN